MKARLSFSLLFLAWLIPSTAGAQDIKTVPILPFKKEDKVWKPDISFIDARGSKKKIADFKGKLVLLNVWATWCTPCLAELPALDRLQEVFVDEPFQVVAVSIDTAKKPEDIAGSWQGMGIKNMGFYLDAEKSIYKNMKINAVPVTFLISPEGELLGTIAGAVEWDDPDQVIPFLKSHLPESSQ